MKLFRVLTLTLLALTSIATTIRSQTDKTLDARMRAEVAQFKGKVSLFARNIDTGAVYTRDGDNRVRTASTIKVAIMVEAFARVAEGKAKWSDEVVLTNSKKVSGSGVLQELSDG